MFRGEHWTQSEGAASEFGLQLVRSARGSGAPVAGVIRQGSGPGVGGNSGAQALGLAMLFGAARVLLLGYDMQFRGAQAHWHGHHGKGLNNPRHGSLAGWAKGFEVLARELRGVDVINCSRETAITAFPRAPLQECLSE